MTPAGHQQLLRLGVGAALLALTALFPAVGSAAPDADDRPGSAIGRSRHVPGSAEPAGSGQGPAPNVFVVMFDDATETMLDWRRPTGDWVMPRLQEFKARATVYSNTFVDIPSCCPSRFSLFTGRYPHNTGGRLQEDGTELPRRDTFPHWLRAAGYVTAMAGKFLLSWPLATAPPDYDRYTTMHGGYDNPVLNRNGTVSTASGYSTALLAGDLKTYVEGFEREDATPWFAYWAPQTPHVGGGFKSLAVPARRHAGVDVGSCAQPGEADRNDKPPYVSFVAPDVAYTQELCASQLRALMSADHQFHELVKHLRALGEYRNTMVVVTSDNGYHWGEQGWFSKFYPYDASTSVPLYVKWPAALGVPGGDDPRLASSLDVTAAIVEVTGVVPTRTLDGRSLLQPGERAEVFAEYFQDAANGDMGTWAMLRAAEWKYVESRQVGRSGAVTEFTEFYDLVADPDESDNLLHDGVVGNEPSAAVLTGLRDRLHAGRACVGADCP